MIDILTHDKYITCELGLYNPSKKLFYTIEKLTDGFSPAIARANVITFVVDMKRVQYELLAVFTPQQLADDLSLYNKERSNEIKSNCNTKG